MGKTEDQARAELRAAEAKLAAAATKRDLEIRAIHFVGTAGSYKLRNDSTEHGNTLTGKEYEAVKTILEGKQKPLPKTDKDGFFEDGGMLATAEDVARLAAQ